jgi:hypothetical protein
VRALKSVHRMSSVGFPECARSPRRRTRRCQAEQHPVHAHRRALVGRGLLGLTVARLCLGHSGRSSRGRPVVTLLCPTVTPRYLIAMFPPGRGLTELHLPFRPLGLFFPVAVTDGPLHWLRQGDHLKSIPLIHVFANRCASQPTLPRLEPCQASL